MDDALLWCDRLIWADKLKERGENVNGKEQDTSYPIR